MGFPVLTNPLSDPWARASTWLLLALGLATVALVTGCYDIRTGDASLGSGIDFKLPAFPETGSNAVQVFTEMHYQPSYRAQEVPRLLPPDGSVPTTGAEIVYASMDEYKALASPGGDAQNGWRLYGVNCLVCHGPNLDGQGKITEFPYTGGPVPANLKADVTRSATAGELFGFISCGGRQGCALRLIGRESASPMPEFRRLLSEQDRWDLVAYLQGVINAR
jgi:mono/diheme cytochrome c family protein